jgi:hypothetical protein
MLLSLVRQLANDHHYSYLVPQTSLLYDRLQFRMTISLEFGAMFGYNPGPPRHTQG